MWEMIDKFSQNVPAWDLVIVLLFCLGVFIFGVVLGRDKILSILFSIYIAFGVTQAVPQEWLSKLPMDAWVLSLVIFAVVLLVSFLVIVLGRVIYAGGPKNIVLRWIQAVIFALISVGLITSVVLSIMPQEAVRNFSLISKDIFTSQWARLVWFVAPVVVMIVGIKRRKGPGRPPN